MTELIPSVHLEGVDLKYPAWLETTRGLVDCAIIRISSGAAQIHLDDDTPIESPFELWLTRNGACRRACRLAQRNGAILIVDFVREKEALGRIQIHKI